MRDLDGGRVAALWFAVASVTSLVTGRLTFALGVAVGLGGRARRRARAPRAGPARWPRWRASPAPWPAPSWRWPPRPGGWTARAGGRWRWRRARWCPPLALAVAFPEGGSFPFVGIELLARAGRGGRRRPRRPARRARGAHRRRALRRGDGGELRAGHADGRQRRAPRRPLRRAGPRRPRVAHATAAPSPCSRCRSLYWQWVAPVDDWARAAGDASVHERYYAGAARLPRRAARRALPPRDPLHRQPLGVALGGAARAAGARMGAPGRPPAQRALL